MRGVNLSDLNRFALLYRDGRIHHISPFDESTPKTVGIVRSSEVERGLKTALTCINKLKKKVIEAKLINALLSVAN